MLSSPRGSGSSLVPEVEAVMVCVCWRTENSAWAFWLASDRGFFAARGDVGEIWLLLSRGACCFVCFRFIWFRLAALFRAWIVGASILWFRFVPLGSVLSGLFLFVLFRLHSLRFVLFRFARRLTDRTKSMLNLGSYNYLGFADDWGNTCRSGVMPVLESLSVGCSINRKDYGELSLFLRSSIVGNLTFRSVKLLRQNALCPMRTWFLFFLLSFLEACDMMHVDEKVKVTVVDEVGSRSNCVGTGALHCLIELMF